MPLCVYAIVGRPVSRRALARVRRPSIRMVTAGAISAVVIECQGKAALSAPALRAHDAVVRLIARLTPAVLPARFGTVIDSESSLVTLLERWSKELQAALALVNRREQMTLRLFASPGAGDARGPGTAGQSGPAGRRVAGAEPIDQSRPGTSYLTRRAREQAQPEAPELDVFREAFAPIVAAERIVRHDHGPLILTAYHLIPRGGATAYRRVLRRCAVALGNRAVPSGPWPPYAFVPELGP